jgi:aerobic carbon-monoxide dehydrogenase large subunit
MPLENPGAGHMVRFPDRVHHAARYGGSPSQIIPVKKPMRTVNTFIGSPVERVEDLRFLRGRGQYVDDLTRPGTLHAAMVRSAVAHGRLRAIDADAARAMPGVYAIITAQDVGRPVPTIPFRRPNPTIVPYAQPVLADGIVRYVGEPVAVVLADSAECAEDAALAVVLDIEHLPALAHWEASARGEALLIPGTSSNCAAVFTANAGDADAAFRRAAYTRRERFRVQRMTAMTMETRGLLAEWDATTGRLSVSGAAKLPFFNRRAMAVMMNLAETGVDYVEYDVGGGFGARGEFYPEDFLVAFAARSYGRPVKWVEDRREHFMAIAHSRETECDLEIACDRDGTILGLRGDIWIDVGAYVRPNGMTPVRNVAQFTTGPYRVPDLHLKAHAFVTNKTPSGTYRGPGRFEGCFFMERLIDMAAKDLGLDRLEIRRRNLIALSEMPYPLAPVRPNDGFGDTACDSGDYTSPFNRCIADAGWREKTALNGKLVDGRYHGIGIACFIEGGASGPRENARIVIERDGSFAVYVGSSSVGQGVETIMAQIAADALEVPIAAVKVYHGSTTYLPEGYGSYGSRATVMGGSAIVATANGLIEKIKAAASERLSVPAEAIAMREGRAFAPDGRYLAMAELAGLCADGKFDNSKATYTYGTAIAHVTVDPQTGGVTVLDYLVVDDVGRIINPETLHGQVIGAAVQGLGSVFTEEIIYDEHGQLLVASLADYLVPVATDYPQVRAVSLEEHPSPNNPLGAKGAGEGGIIPLGGAVANAVAAALASFGVEPRVLPLTPARVWQLIQDGRKQ